MRGLEKDMAEVAQGIWTEDHEVVATAARRIADHPKVIHDQMGAIQAALGSEFPAFVQQDRGVHEAAVELAEAADSSIEMLELFAINLRIQQGCMSCHTVFRARVSEALIGEGGGE
jgi:hypothetical protein